MSKNKIERKSSKAETLALGKTNYILMIVSVVIIAIGFVLMIGGNNNDPNVFNPEVFSFRRITLAPMVSLFGFMFMIYAIMKKPESKE